MLGKRRITNPILAIVSTDGHHEAVTVPAGAFIETNNKKFNGERLMEVLLDGRLVLMFTEDLKTSSVTAQFRIGGKGSMVGSFRLTKDTLGVLIASRLGVCIPAGAIIEIPIATLDGNRAVDVLWEGKTMMMFVEDLRTRAVQI